MKINEKTLDISLLIGAAAAIILAAFSCFSRRCGEMQDKAFRLHILANSDSAEDQQIKYALRDYILSDIGDMLAGCASKERAAVAARRNIGYITERANEFLEKSGCGYTAECSVGKREFPTRRYGDVTLPAGEYDALTVVIGKGEGHNWWCVLFPSVCLPAAAEPASPLPSRSFYEEQKKKARLTADSLAVEAGKGIEFRFALYEWLRGVMSGGYSASP